MPSVDLTSPREYSSPATMLSSWVYRSSKPRNQLQHFEAARGPHLSYPLNCSWGAGLSRGLRKSGNK